MHSSKHLPSSIAVMLLVGSLGGPALAAPMPQPPVAVPGVGLEIRFADRRPPRLRHERRPQRPHADAVWVAGFWDWRDDGWIWVDGRWERPMRRGARWVQARYVRLGPGWRYEPGHWSHERLHEGDDYRRHHDDSRRGHR